MGEVLPFRKPARNTSLVKRAPTERHEEDPRSAPRGMFLGCLGGLISWAFIVGLIYLAVSYLL